MARNNLDLTKNVEILCKKQEQKIGLGSNELADQFLNIIEELNIALHECKLNSPVSFVYNPLDLEYSNVVHAAFIKKYLSSGVKILFVGLNPGPGTVQTGIAFSDANSVNSLGIQCDIEYLINSCSDKQVRDICSEESSTCCKRFWKFAEKISDNADDFFKKAFGYSYCPLLFKMKNGDYTTPQDIKNQSSNVEELKKLEAVCDEAFYKIVTLLKPKIIVTIGKYVNDRVKLIFEENKLNIDLECLPHTSERDNWPEVAYNMLKHLELFSLEN